MNTESERRGARRPTTALLFGIGFFIVVLLVILFAVWPQRENPGEPFEFSRPTPLPRVSLEPPPAPPDTPSLSLTKKDKQPVTGAFGWRLGEKLDPAKHSVDLDTNGLYSLLLTGSGAPNISPFSAVLICANKEAKIYSIYCSAHGLNDYLDRRHILVQTLQGMYSPLSSFEDTYTFGDKERTVTLTCWDEQKGFSLEYRYEPLAKAIPAEQSPRRRQELQKAFGAL